MQHIPLLLQGTREIASREFPACFVLVQHGPGGAGVARTLYLEAPRHAVCVVEVPHAHPQMVEWVLAEIQTAHGYSEARYDEHGKRTVPTLQLLALTAENSAPITLDSNDVLLVTGGGKGIAAECAFSLALQTGVRLALLGRSRPSEDPELAENLKRFTAAEIEFCYISADVTRSEEVERAIGEVKQKMGSATAIIHGAGANTPRLLNMLNETEFLKTLGPKVEGLKHLLAAIDPQQLRLLVTFGSVIARTGMRGEADYALANDWMAYLTEQFQAEHPGCRCLCLEWSVWAGVGMGERLGRVEALIREGIMPISVDGGVACFRALLDHCLPQVRMVVTSRFGSTPTLQTVTPDMPFLRFLEKPRIYYPGIELITDVEISTATDPYLEDHKLLGERLLPAVVGLEAMAQVAQAVTGNEQRPHFEQIQLTRPVIIPETGSLKIRLASLVSESGDIHIVLRSEETGFQVDHFRATCRFSNQTPEKLAHLSGLPTAESEQGQQVLVDPAHELYGNILFHQGLFQRVQRYTHLRATECVAEITPYRGGSLFAHYLPPRLVLGDFLSRDAVIHCIQSCIPHARLLPIAVEEISFAAIEENQEQVYRVHARERSRVGDIFTYDVEVRTVHGDLLEQWRGLQLRQVEALPLQATWNESLLGAYMERKLSEFIPEASIRVSIQRFADLERRTRSNRAFQSLLGSTRTVQRRPDGKPASIKQLPLMLSASHHAQLTLTAASLRAIGCDIESIVNRSALLWHDLLGQERTQLASFLASQIGEDIDTSATRLWAAGECLKKAGALVNVPLRFGARKENDWIVLKAGSFLIFTYIAQVQGEEGRMVFAICVGVESSAEMEQAIRL